MNPLTTCKPLFSHVAHLMLAAHDTYGMPTQEAIGEELTTILRKTKNTLITTAPSTWKAIWFALNCWLTEILTSHTWGKHAAASLEPLPEDAAETYFHTLDSLLPRDPDTCLSPEEAAIIDVFALCLDLGFRGGMTEAQLRRYRKKCKETLARKAPEPFETLVNDKANRSGTPYGRLAATALWLTPILAAFLLHSAYKSILRRLLTSVIQ